MSNLNLREGAWYRRHDGKVVGPLRHCRRVDGRTGARWRIDSVNSSYRYDGTRPHGPDHLGLAEEVPPPDWFETAEPVKQLSVQLTPQPRSIVAIVDGTKIELTMSDAGVSQKGWDKPISKKSLAALVELLMEQL